MSLYQTLDQVTSDLTLYMVATQGGKPTLSMFPQLAKVRWTWICVNWSKTIYNSLIDRTQGDDYLKKILSEMVKDVKLVHLGATSYNPFDDILKISFYRPLLELIDLSSLGLTADESNLVREEYSRVKKFNVTTFIEMTSYLRNECAIASQRISMGDIDGVSAMNAPTVDAYRKYQISDLKQIDNVLELADFIDGIIFALKQKTDYSPNLLVAANKNINTTSSVRVNTNYISSIAVPFEQSLEFMAEKYLKDKSRWFELVTINNLQPPFVDLTGTKEYLQVTGSSSIIRITDLNKNKLSIGSRIRIGSARYQEEIRYIESIIDNKDSTLTLSLSGESNLSKFKSSELAFIRIFAPSTVNELSIILIPQNVIAPYGKQPIPSSDELRRLDQALLSFGVDTKRDETTNDIVISTGGDFELIAGIPAVKQALLYVMKTTQGENLWHKKYGITSRIGDTWVGGIDEGIKIAQVIQDSISKDGRYKSVTVTNIKATPNSLAIDFVVQIIGSNKLIPLSFVG